MKKLSLIFFICVVLVGCKSIKSHVQKSYNDSLSINRELSNSELFSISAKTITTSIFTDSSTKHLIKLDSFSGSITPVRIEGSAKQIYILGDLDLKKSSVIHHAILDQSEASDQTERESVKKVENIQVENKKETKGNRPWWVWPVGIVSMLLVAIYFLSKVKSKLKLF